MFLSRKRECRGKNLWENRREGRAYVGEISAAEEMENGYTYFMTHDAKTGDTL